MDIDIDELTDRWIVGWMGYMYGWMDGYNIWIGYMDG